MTTEGKNYTEVKLPSGVMAMVRYSFSGYQRELLEAIFQDSIVISVEEGKTPDQADRNEVCGTGTAKIKQKLKRFEIYVIELNGKGTAESILNEVKSLSEEDYNALYRATKKK